VITLDEGFSRAVELILQRLAAGGKIVVAGVGKSFLVGQKIAATLASTGSPSLAIHPAQAMHGDIGILNQRDVLLGLSFSGESGELLDMLPVVRRQGAGIVALTGMPESTLARLERCGCNVMRVVARSLSVQHGADGQHDRDAGRGRRPGDRVAGGARF
jgi:D-arabinose 5-phosphate isomerase GutQ